VQLKLPSLFDDAVDVGKSPHAECRGAETM
jgi:hypothetical protein